MADDNDGVKKFYPHPNLELIGHRMREANAYLVEQVRAGRLKNAIPSPASDRSDLAVKG